MDKRGAIGLKRAPPRGNVFERDCGQVSWLWGYKPDGVRSVLKTAFPEATRCALPHPVAIGLETPMTVAGPRRISTGFPLSVRRAVEHPQSVFSFQSAERKSQAAVRQGVSSVTALWPAPSSTRLPPLPRHLTHPCIGRMAG